MYTHATDAGWISRTHRAIAPFRLQRPTTPAEAVAALSEADDALVIAGGIDLVRRMRSGDTAGTLIDLSGLSALRAIEDRGDFIRIGALATHWDVETSPLLAARLPAFQAAWTTIGNVRIRMTGTVGGNLMAAERAYDGPVLLGAIGAKLVFLTDAGEVVLSASSPPQGFPKRALLTAIDIPVSAAARFGFDRSLKPVVSVAVALDGDSTSVAVGCAYISPFFWSGQVTDVEGSLSAVLPDPIDNPMGGSAYRRRMIGVLSRRLIEKLQRGDAS
ncbi:MAG: carbon-monoxide dehydrogenase medium subunit [Paracoccaceae bacterium]|jgi:carbon-monoxide dehydrogenase medium subunit